MRCRRFGTGTGRGARGAIGGSLAVRRGRPTGDIVHSDLDGVRHPMHGLRRRRAHVRAGTRCHRRRRLGARQRRHEDEGAEGIEGRDGELREAPGQRELQRLQLQAPGGRGLQGGHRARGCNELGGLFEGRAHVLRQPGHGEELVLLSLGKAVDVRAAAGFEQAERERDVFRRVPVHAEQLAQGLDPLLQASHARAYRRGLPEPPLSRPAQGHEGGPGLPELPLQGRELAHAPGLRGSNSFGDRCEDLLRAGQGFLELMQPTNGLRPIRDGTLQPQRDLGPTARQRRVEFGNVAGQQTLKLGCQFLPLQRISFQARGLAGRSEPIVIEIKNIRRRSRGAAPSQEPTPRQRRCRTVWRRLRRLRWKLQWPLRRPIRPASVQITRTAGNTVLASNFALLAGANDPMQVQEIEG
mmetsp:Transcript_86087/g.278084  ORF Transcript_86087/g.278084 Transcript_86087/m.278084 type:complete len:411 (-) Transcript_86087:1730-2962(-)